MQRDIAAGDFIEHAEFSGNLYGTRWATLGTSTPSQGLCLQLDRTSEGRLGSWESGPQPSQGSSSAGPSSQPPLSTWPSHGEVRGLL